MEDDMSWLFSSFRLVLFLLMVLSFTILLTILLKLVSPFGGKIQVEERREEQEQIIKTKRILQLVGS